MFLLLIVSDVTSQFPILGYNTTLRPMSEAVTRRGCSVTFCSHHRLLVRAAAERAFSSMKDQSASRLGSLLLGAIMESRMCNTSEVSEEFPSSEGSDE